MEQRRSRSFWSTALVAFATGPFGGFLWIGAGLWAVVAFLAIGAIALYLVYSGLPPLPVGADLIDLILTPLTGIVSVALVVPFTKRFTADKWYSNGFAVTGLVLVISGGIALSIRTFLFQPFSIPAGSMYPTLEVGDHMFANKFAYGYGRYSFPFGLFPVEGRIFGSEPQRGDVVVLRPASFPELDYVKRVVGLPGETIQMIDGVLHIDQKPVLLEEIGPYDSEEFQGVLQRETLPNGVSYSVINLADNSLGDNTRVFAIPAGHYFVMGDNRDNSSDSRFNVGFVPWANLVGRADYIFWNSNGTNYRDRQELRPRHAE